jgi:F-type H+-transporting ATPase subunit epsilon
MSAPKFKLEIVTPAGIVFKQDIVSLKAPGSEGFFGVLANHAPFMTSLTIGVIEAFDGEKSHFLATSGGFCETLPHKTTILAETAELKENIDVARAQASYERAQKRISVKTADIDIERAQLALARAINRLKIAGVFK